MLGDVALEAAREIANPADQERQIRDTYKISQGIFASWLGLDLLNGLIADEEGKRNMAELAERVGPEVMQEAERLVGMNEAPAMPEPPASFQQLDLGI